MEEDKVMSSFRVAANSLAVLYKESVSQSKASYRSGYEQALQDMWEYISLQHSQSLQEGSPATDILSFIRLKHAELNSGALEDMQEKFNKPIPPPASSSQTNNIGSPAASSAAPTTFELSNSIENLASENGAKRRWGYTAEELKDITMDSIEHLPKRPKNKFERMD